MYSAPDSSSCPDERGIASVTMHLSRAKINEPFVVPVAPHAPLFFPVARWGKLAWRRGREALLDTEVSCRLQGPVSPREGVSRRILTFRGRTPRSSAATHLLDVQEQRHLTRRNGPCRQRGWTRQVRPASKRLITASRRRGFELLFSSILHSPKPVISGVKRAYLSV